MCYLSFVGTSMVERNVFPQFVLVGEASGDFAEGANKHFALFSGWRGHLAPGPLYNRAYFVKRRS